MTFLDLLFLHFTIDAAPLKWWRAGGFMVDLSIGRASILHIEADYMHVVYMIAAAILYKLIKRAARYIKTRRAAARIVAGMIAE